MQLYDLYGKVWQWIGSNSPQLCVVGVAIPIIGTVIGWASRRAHQLARVHGDIPRFFALGSLVFSVALVLPSIFVLGFAWKLWGSLLLSAFIAAVITRHRWSALLACAWCVLSFLLLGQSATLCANSIAGLWADSLQFAALAATLGGVSIFFLYAVWPDRSPLLVWLAVASVFATPWGIARRFNNPDKLLTTVGLIGLAVVAMTLISGAAWMTLVLRRQSVD